jgi:tetratricopeptide (TPR) repeat protein
MAVVGLILAFVSPLAQAHTSGAGLYRPVLQDDPKKVEYDLYKKWYDANQGQKYEEALKYAEEYLQKFPSGQYAGYLKNTWLPPVRSRIRGAKFEEARKNKNTAEVLRIAREALAEDPENLDYIYLVIYHLRQNHLVTPNNYSYVSELAEFTNKAMQLVEAGKIPNVVDKTKWKQNEVLAYFNETLGKVEEHKKDDDKALEYYTKSATLDPAKPIHYFDVGRLHQKKYVKAVEEYNKIPEEKRNAPEDQMEPEVKAAFNEVNKQVDKVIENWARFMALSASKPEWDTTRTQVNGELVKLYNYRHPDTPDGLQKLIDQYRTGAPSASSNGNSTKP